MWRPIRCLQVPGRNQSYRNVFLPYRSRAGSVQRFGADLVPLLESNTADWDDRYLFTHKGRWKTGAEPNDFQWKGFAVRNQRFRFIDNAMLFDMTNDPGQTTNVIDEYPEVVEKMRAAYDAWWQITRPMMVNEGVPMSPTRPYHVLFEQQMKDIF